VQSISEHCSIFTSSLYQTNSTVIDFGDKVLLIDPTWLPSEIDAIKSFIQERYPNKALWIFITHFDYDHVWGVPAFRDAHIIAPSLVGMEDLGVKCLQQWQKWDEDHYIKRAYPPILPIHEFFLFNNPTLLWGDNILSFYHSPGHTADSYCCIIEPEGILIAGDYLCDVEIPWIGTSIKEYKQSLLQFKDIVNQHKITLCIPGHGSAIEGKDAILNRIEEGICYLNLLPEQNNESETALQELINQYPFPLASREIHELNKKFISS
jgi:hydroxyacylglutathione hydrolase